MELRFGHDVALTLEVGWVVVVVPSIVGWRQKMVSSPMRREGQGRRREKNKEEGKKTLWCTIVVGCINAPSDLNH